MPCATDADLSVPLNTFGELQRDIQMVARRRILPSMPGASSLRQSVYKAKVSLPFAAVASKAIASTKMTSLSA
jgi:hypothetical protein